MKTTALLMFFTTSLTLSCFAVKSPADHASQEIEAHFELGQEITNVKQYIQNIQSPIRLVMGVNNGEENLDRFDESYVYLNNSHTGPHDQRSLTIDFNNLSQLNFLASRLSLTFDEIYLDESTFKYTEWTEDHLNDFKALLKTKGKFVFTPILHSTPDFDLQYSTLNDLQKDLETNVKSEKKLVTNLCLPDQFPIEQGKYSDEISKIVNIHKGLWGLSQDDAFKKLEEMNLSKIGVYPDEVLNDNVLLLDLVTREVNKDHFVENFFETIIVNTNYIPILESVFGQGNVIAEKNKPLPFKTNYQEKSVLMTSIKKG